MPDERATLLVYNTVDRLLRGDFYHFTTIERVQSDLSQFQLSRPIVGLGTSNWFKRNGELIVEGLVESPKFLWADPTSVPPGQIADLAHALPEQPENLITPVVGQDDTSVEFPFIAIAVCNLDEEITLTIPAGTVFHDWVEKIMVAESIGLAGISVEGLFESIEYTAMCYLPGGGLNLDAGYTLEDNFKFGQVDQQSWALKGLYAANTTIQAMVSVVGHPLHLHGHAVEKSIGGHVNKIVTSTRTKITIWPVKDIVLKISDLDEAWLPVKDMMSDETLQANAPSADTIPAPDSITASSNSREATSNSLTSQEAVATVKRQEKVVTAAEHESGEEREVITKVQSTTEQFTTPSHKIVDQPEAVITPIGIEALADLIAHQPSLLAELTDFFLKETPHLSGDLQKWIFDLHAWYQTKPNLKR